MPTSIKLNVLKQMWEDVTHPIKDSSSRCLKRSVIWPIQKLPTKPRARSRSHVATNLYKNHDLPTSGANRIPASPSFTKRSTHQALKIYLVSTRPRKFASKTTAVDISKQQSSSQHNQFRRSKRMIADVRAFDDEQQNIMLSMPLSIPTRLSIT